MPISGVVNAPDGTAQSGATVYIIDSDTDSIVATLTTDANGAFSYEPPISGTYHVATQYDDGAGGQFNAESYPKIAYEVAVPAYIENKGVLWLPFGEGSGTTSTDKLGNGHDATITGAAWVSGTWVDDFALSYDGIDDYSAVSNAAALNFGTGNFAIAATVNPTSTANASEAKGLVSKYQLGGARTPHYQFNRQGGSAEWRLRIRDANGNTATPTAPIDSAQLPARLVGVREGETCSIYLNGSLANSQTVAGLGNTDNADPLHIGRYWTSSSFDGAIDDVIVFNQALTDAEITDDYNRQPWS